jgi:hypothetical protein
MTDTNPSKELVRLATGCLSNKIPVEELSKAIKKILVSNDYILDELLEECVEFTTDFEIIELLQNVSEQVSYSKNLLGADNKKYFCNLFAIPVVFVKKEGSEIESIENFEPELEEISRALRKSKVFNHECKIHIHNKLFSPEQLMVLNYNYIYSFMNEMSNLCFDKPSNILEAPQFESEPCDEETLYVRYLFGIRVFRHEAEQLSAEEEYAVMNDFNNIAVPILGKVLDGYNVSVIGVDEFYPAIQVGLEFYTSLSRRLAIEQHLKTNHVTADYCGAMIVIDLDDIEESYIELTSKFNEEVIGTAQVYPLRYQEPKELIGTITEELAEMGFEMDNVNIKADDQVYPIDFFLKFEDEIEVASTVCNFLDNPDLGE